MLAMMEDIRLTFHPLHSNEEGLVCSVLFLWIPQFVMKENLRRERFRLKTFTTEAFLSVE